MIGAILGIIGAALPNFLKLWQDKQDKKHELAIMDKQIAMQEKGMQYRLEEVQTQGEVETMKALYEMSKPVEFKPTGMKWADSITRILEIVMYFYRSSVQPTITYAICILYAWIKWTQFLKYGYVGWTSFDEEIMWATISYFFTGRYFQRSGQYKQK